MHIYIYITREREKARNLNAHELDDVGVVHEPHHLALLEASGLSLRYILFFLPHIWLRLGRFILLLPYALPLSNVSCVEISYILRILDIFSDILLRGGVP